MVSVILQKNLLKVSMTESELADLLSYNIKKYRGKMLTQESLAERAGLSVQLINGIEGGRKWVSKSSLSKLAAALGVEVYQLFIPQNHEPIVIEETPENEKIKNQLAEKIIEDVRNSVNKTLDKIQV